MHAEYFAGIAKYDFGSIAKKIDEKSGFGFSFLRFGVDNIPNTSELIDAQGNVNYGRISYFSAADMAFIGSYGRKINEYISIGSSAKIINRTAETLLQLGVLELIFLLRILIMIGLDIKKMLHC